MSLFHASITKVFCTVKRSHTVITFAAQPFHWRETESRGGRSREESRWGEKQKKKTETESGRKQQGPEASVGEEMR